MKYRLMDILACPYDKHFPLELYVFKVNKYDRNVKFKQKPACELYCEYRKKYIKDLGEEDPGCEECIKYEVDLGILFCPECNRWYPIIDEIPILLPDEMRNKKEDLEFLKKNKDGIPSKIIEKGKPWNLSMEG